MRFSNSFDYYIGVSYDPLNPHSVPLLSKIQEFAVFWLIFMPKAALT
jgi:hypothetical protein